MCSSDLADMSLIALVFASFVACEPPPPPIPGELERSGTTLVTVNDKAVTQGMLDARIAQFPAEARDRILAQGTARIKDQLVTDEVLYQEALKQKLHEKTEIKQAMAFAERAVLANALLEQVVKDRSNDEAVKAWYDEHKVQFAKPQVKASHILVKEKEEADAVLKEVQGGADFATLAKAKSTDKGSAEKGGDFGWFEQKRMVKEFADAAFAAEKGAIVGPVQTRFGYHIIKVEDKREAIPLEEAAEQIKSQMKSEIAEKYVEELKKSATVTEAGGAGASVTAPAGAPAAPAAPAEKK